MRNGHYPSDSLKEGNERPNIDICALSKDLADFGKENNQDTKEPTWKRRYVVAIVSFLTFFIIHIQRSSISVLIVAMVNNTAISQETKASSESCQEFTSNSSEHDIVLGSKAEGELLWSPRMQGYILGSIYIGHVLVQIPAGRFAERYGCKWLLLGSLLLSSMLTVLIPPFSWISPYAVIVIQIIRGTAMGANAPCVSVLISNWSPKFERGFLFSIVLSSFSLGQVIGNIIAGYLSELPGGWTYAYYIFGGSGIVLGVYILFFITETPSEDSRISKVELQFILSNQESASSHKRPNLPWRQLLTSAPVYAMVFAVFGRFWAASQFATVHSTFLGTILHYPMGQNGLFSAIPNLLSFVSSNIASWISLYMQKKKVVSIDFLRKFWTLLPSIGYSLCFLGVYIAGCNRNLSVIFATLSLGSHGLGYTGCHVVAQDMAPAFAGTLHSINLTAGFLSSLLLPLLVGYLTNEMRTIEQWNKVFLISIGIIMSSSILFVTFGSAKTQPWNFVKNERKNEDDGTNEKNPEKERNDEMTKF